MGIIKNIASAIIIKIDAWYRGGIFPSNLKRKASHTDTAIKKISDATKNNNLVSADFLNIFLKKDIIMTFLIYLSVKSSAPFCNNFISNS